MSGAVAFFVSSSSSSCCFFKKHIPCSSCVLPLPNSRSSFLSLRRPKKQTGVSCTSYEVADGFPEVGNASIPHGLGGFDEAAAQDEEKWDSAKYEALLKGGEQVTSVMKDMIKLLEDIGMDETSEAAALEIVAQGVIGKRVDEMEGGFMMALDYMIKLAEKDNDDKRKSILEVIKETVLAHLTKKCPPHVQVIGLLCQTPSKEGRYELLRRVAAGGGLVNGENGAKVHIPGANLNDIANQADDILETMEAKPSVPDRKLLARLVLIREEARNMMGGGILDERNDRGFRTLPEAEINFILKLVAIKPGKRVQEMLKNVMQGKDEGADHSSKDGEETEGEQKLEGIAGRGSISGHKPRPVRPGTFLETVDKVLGGVYTGNVSGITAQHLEWVHQKTLQILQEMAFS